MNNLTMPVYLHPIKPTFSVLQAHPAVLLTGTLVIASALYIGSNLVDI